MRRLISTCLGVILLTILSHRYIFKHDSDWVSWARGKECHHDLVLIHVLHMEFFVHIGKLTQRGKGKGYILRMSRVFYSHWETSSK